MMKSFILTFLVLGLNQAYSQTGLFVYPNFEIDEKFNNRIIDIDVYEKEIFLLGKITGDNYINPMPWLGRIDLKGNLVFGKVIKEETYELNSLSVLDPMKIRIYGSKVSNNMFVPYIKTVDKEGNSSMSEVILANNSILFGDVFVNANDGYIVQSNYTTTASVYNIAVIKFDKNSEDQVWFKKIPSADNEEASKVFVAKDNKLLIIGKKYSVDLQSYNPIVYFLSSSGEIIWKKEFPEFSNFASQGLSADSAGNPCVIFSFGSEKSIDCYTHFIRLASNGKEMERKRINKIRAGGILHLKDGNILIYGTSFQKSEMALISKGKFVIMDRTFNIIKEDELGMFDEPDVNLPGMMISIYPTSSDFLCASQLNDGRVVLGGRVFMPKDEKALNSIYRTNRAFLLIMEKDGKFRKE